MVGRVSAIVLIAGLAATLAVALLRDNRPTEPTFTNVEAVTPDLTGADRRLAAIADQANELLPGETEAFDARLKQLKGLPVVANKWAHWCGPCKAEFPILQQAAKELGGEVAFLGVNYNDSRDAATDFLKDYPVPYPSYFDPNLRIAQQFPPTAGAPVTNFYDTDGRLVYVEAGPFSSLADLKEKLTRYTGFKPKE
ncbi:MAG: TlpA family protein disulfide reductase [Solirubrobacterales bacterium]